MGEQSSRPPRLIEWEGKMEAGVHRQTGPAPAAFEWYRQLSANGRAAFWASFAGWALDSYDFWVLSFALLAILSAFHLTQAQGGLLATATLLVSALGGMIAGVLADRVGRVRTLMMTVAVYSVFTFLSGLSQNYGQLLVFRSLQGLGFGGEWAAGAILVSELADPEQRGRLLGWVQSAWAIGWGLCNAAALVVFSLTAPTTGWRWLFWLGILPALLILYIRTRVREPEIYRETAEARGARSDEARSQGATRSSLVQIFSPDLLPTTLLASLLAAGAQGGYYSIFTWLPTYLKTVRHLNVVGTGASLFVVIAGAFAGYVASAYFNDSLGRKKTFAIFAVVSAVVVVLYTQLPQAAAGVLPLLGFVLGFCASGIFSGFGSYLAEIYPTRARGAGQGFCYNAGRAVGALFPLAIGVLSTKAGLGGAIAFGAAAYALCVVALLFLPETRGKRLVAIA
jgi:MFS family permease